MNGYFLFNLVFIMEKSGLGTTKKSEKLAVKYKSGGLTPISSFCHRLCYVQITDLAPLLPNIFLREKTARTGQSLL